MLCAGASSAYGCVSLCFVYRPHCTHRRAIGVPSSIVVVCLSGQIRRIIIYQTRPNAVDLVRCFIYFFLLIFRFLHLFSFIITYFTTEFISTASRSRTASISQPILHEMGAGEWSEVWERVRERRKETERERRRGASSDRNKNYVSSNFNSSSQQSEQSPGTAARIHIFDGVLKA